MRYILSRLLCNDFEWAPYGLQKSLPALPFLPPHYFPPITTGWDTLEKSSCYHRFFLHCTCKLEEGTYSQYCIAKGKKSRTGPAIQHTQAPARSRTLFHCVCTRVSELWVWVKNMCASSILQQCITLQPNQMNSFYSLLFLCSNAISSNVFSDVRKATSQISY